MTYAPLSFWLVTVVSLAAEATLTLVARRRGRDAPWNLSISYTPPRFADSRLNSIESFLLVVLMPLGILLALAGVGVAIWLDHVAVGFSLILLGWAFLLARGIFLAACLAFARLAGDTVPSHRA